MGKTKIILLVTFLLIVTLSTISYAYGWRITLQEPESSAPTLEEPAPYYT